MHRSISYFCLLSLWGFGPGMQAELRAVELHAREEARTPFGVEVRAPEVNVLAGTLGGAWPAFGEDDAGQRAESLMSDAPGADSSVYDPRVFFVPPEADSAPRSLFSPRPSEPLLRPIPTYWPPDVFMLIPTTWDAEIVLLKDTWRMHGLQGDWQQILPGRGVARVAPTD